MATHLERIMSASAVKEVAGEQYREFLRQCRAEVSELYSLYNVFLLLNSGLLFYALGLDPTGTARWHLLAMGSVGFLLALVWWWITAKQGRARNTWIHRIRELDKHLSDHLRMWPERSAGTTMTFWGEVRETFFGERRKLRTLLFLPVIVALVWVVWGVMVLVRHCG